jgi:Type II secretion system (T2SS), protein G
MEPTQRLRIRVLTCRLIAAIVVGVAVAGTAYLAMFNGHRGFWDLYHGGVDTQRHLDELEVAIEKHRGETGRLPATLAELVPPTDHRAGWVRADGKIADRWDNPYPYRVEGNGYELFSLGRDGRPGGEGLDADIYPKSVGRPREMPTLRQFAFELETKGVMVLCALAGACSAIVCVLPFPKRSRAERLGRIVATIVGTFIAAVVMSLAHVPSGH